MTGCRGWRRYSGLRGGHPYRSGVGDRVERCWRAIGALPPQQHAVAVMRWLFAMTNRQIAAALGIAEGTVAAHVSAVRGN